MSRTTWWTALVAATVVPMVMSCDAPMAPVPATPVHTPVPGQLVVSLAAAPAPAGAVVLLIRGDGIGEPTGYGDAYHVFVHGFDSGIAYRVAVVGSKVTGALVSFTVPDVTRPEAYTVTLLEVADESNQLRADIAEYRLSLRASRNTDAPAVTNQE